MEKARPGTWLEVGEVQAGQADVRSSLRTAPSPRKALPGQGSLFPRSWVPAGAGRRSPSRLDQGREARRRRMLEEGLQLPGVAARPRGEGLLLLCAPSSCQPAAGTWREAAQGTGAASEPWREGSAPASPLNYSWLRGEGSCQRHAAAVSSSPSASIPIPPLPWGELPQRESTGTATGGDGEEEGQRGGTTLQSPCMQGGPSAPCSEPWLPADGQQPCSHPKASTPSAAVTPSPACPEPPPAPASFTQQHPGGGNGGIMRSLSPLHSRETEAGTPTQGPGSRGQVLLPLAPPRAQGGQGPSRGCHCHRP